MTKKMYFCTLKILSRLLINHAWISILLKVQF